jgi:hypothetical protein
MIITRITICILLACNVVIYSLAQQPTTMYCHGLGGSEHEVKGLIKNSIIQEPAIGIAFKKENDSCLGHGRNVKTLQENINSKEKHIYYGISCGGAGIINLLAEDGSKNAKAVIIDATPCDIINLADEVQYKIGIFILWTRAQKEWAVRMLFPEYPANSIPPMQAIAKIENKDLPVFIVHSHNDPVVDIRSAWHNYKAFKQANFSHVYICELQEGGHMSNASGPDSLIYKQAINSFYKKYGLKYDKKYATLTEKDLKKLQPSEQEIDEKISRNLSKLRKQGLINLGIYATVEKLLAALSK